jgi:hypothetical protein
MTLVQNLRSRHSFISEEAKQLLTHGFMLTDYSVIVCQYAKNVPANRNLTCNHREFDLMILFTIDTGT